MIWTCRDGTEIEISGMTDLHLANTRAMLERRLGDMEDNLSAAWSMMFQGEMANFYLDHDRKVLEGEIDECRNWIRLMTEEEAARAKL